MKVKLWRRAFAASMSAVMLLGAISSSVEFAKL